MMGQKVEAQTLRVAANNQGYQIRGDVRINGTPAPLDYRKATGEAEAEVASTATLDEAARARLGFEFGPPSAGRCRSSSPAASATRECSRFTVDADLTQAKIDNLMPGWVKPPASRPAPTFTLVKDKTRRGSRIFVIDGSGRGARQRRARFLRRNPGREFSGLRLSDGDKAKLRADRAADGTLRVRCAAKSTTAALSSNRRWAAAERSEGQGQARPISISTSGSARLPVTMARRCAASN